MGLAMKRSASCFRLSLVIATLCVMPIGALVGLTTVQESGTPPQQQLPIFRAATTRVRVDVVAIDGDGAFVDDLSASELVVLEDGEPQEILSLQLVDVRTGETVAAGLPEVAVGGGTGSVGGRAEAAVTPDPRAAKNNVTPAATTRPASELGAVIYLVDGLGLSTRNQIRLSMRWNAELRDREALSVPHALYWIDKIGQTREIVPLTDDIAALQQGVVGLEALAETDLFRGLRLRDPSVQRFGLLKQFCEALAGRSGRTVLVYVSTGIRLTKAGWPDTRVLKLQEEMHEAANAANVSLYSIDPSLMYELTGTGVDASTTTGRARSVRAGSARDALGDSLRNAAAATGGRAFVGWADLGRVIDHIQEDTSRYYLLTYEPRRPGNDGGYHEIEVQVIRPGVRVRARRGYVDDPPGVQERRRLSGAFSLPGVSGSIPITVETLPELSPSGEPRHVVRVAVDVAELRPAVLETGARAVRASFHVGVNVVGGDTVFLGAETLTREIRTATAGNDPEDTPGRSRPEGSPDLLSHSETIELEPGDYELKVVVVDEIGDRIGARGMTLSVTPSRSTGSAYFQIPYRIEENRTQD